MVTEVFTVIIDQWQIVSGILLFIALGQALVSITLKNLSGIQLTVSEYFSLGLAGWILPIFSISLLWFLLGFTSSAPYNWLIIPAGILILVLILFRLKSHPEPDSKKIIFSLLTLVLLFILLRLVFVSQATLPSYFDSAQHYSIVKNILQNGAILSPDSTTYYHPGFHILTAFLVGVLNADIAVTMLILGQLVLGIMPVSIFFLVRRLTGSSRAGVLAVILSALGWYMPAHAVNWGKYPALMSLALLPFVLSLGYLFVQSSVKIIPQKRWILYIMLGLSVAVSTLLHSRSLVILIILLLSWIITVWQQSLSFINRCLIFVVIFITLVLEIIFIQKQAVFVPLFDPYLHKGIWITTLVLLLSIFALREYSKVVFASLLSMCILLGSLFVPIRLPGYGALTLLDRPLVEMILYLPLSLVGGLGLAGLEKLLPRPSSWRFSPGEYVQVFMIVLIVIHALPGYNFYPSECCVLAGSDDVAALTWMEEDLPVDARIGISVTELNVLPSEALEAYAGADAGIWITPLTDRVTNPLFYGTDFGQEIVLDKLCESGVSHLYVGGLGQPFDSARLHEHPEWYKVFLSKPKARVYEVIGCE